MPKRSRLKEQTIMKAFGSLSDAGKRKVLALLKRTMNDDALTIDGFFDDLRDKRFCKGFSCPRCHDKDVVRNGAPNGRQRYLCRGCNRTFSDHTCTPLRGTHYPELWPIFMGHMISGYSIRKSAKILNVAASTVFTWRHKVLNALKRMALSEFDGLLEVDETYFLYSEKGKKDISGRKPRKRGGPSKYRGISREQVCVVVARDRTKQTHSRVACMGPITKLKANTLLAPYVGQVSTICSDANGTWRVFSNEAGVEHQELNMKRKRRVIKRIYHIQNVNAFHSRLKDWMHRFKGVATKFLDNYLAWFRFLDAHSRQAMEAKKTELLLSSCLPISPDRYLEIRNTKLSLP